MGLFTKSSKEKFPWSQLTSNEELDQIIADSGNNIIFKHSTRCSISSMALSRFESSWEKREDVKVWYLDLLAYRNISNAIAEKLNVQHQSPQAIALKNGEVVAHSSHGDIDAIKLSEELNK